ncbi:hypothetical protein PIB30_029969 [Stylosanthes scabra]|uniref:Uncharacterized protein n=1 Tax=Stylosanthes scabra TaxID=79078 RepID=A0ABU6XB35_9FABA|nr:hypothetical protein [Stylosanthes scabra]
MGIKHAKDMNYAFMIKIEWELVDKKYYMWAKFLKSKYNCSDDIIPLVHRKNDMSNLWKWGSWDKRKLTEQLPNMVVKKILAMTLSPLGNNLTILFEILLLMESLVLEAPTIPLLKIRDILTIFSDLFSCEMALKEFKLLFESGSSRISLLKTIGQLSCWHHSDQAKKEFKVEVEAIGPVRHMNLVRSLREDAHAFNSEEETDDLKLQFELQEQLFMLFNGRFHDMVIENEFDKKKLIGDVISLTHIGATFDEIGALENMKHTLKELVMLPI